MNEIQKLTKRVDFLEEEIENFRSLLLNLSISQDYSDEMIINHLNVDELLINLYRVAKD